MSPQRVAIISGAAQGIGKGVALRLADDGLDVAIVDLDAQREKLNIVATEIRSKGRRSLVLTADVSEEDQVKALVANVVAELGGLDVMVANAGIFIFGSILETSAEQWDKVMGVNARGVFLQYKYAAEQMVKQGRGGRIIGACSINGKRGHPNMGSYIASKFAVRGITQTAARELGEYGITVNAYAPGTVSTELIPATQEERDALAVKTGFPAGMPLVGTENVAGLVSYLIKPEACFITGQSIIIDGGIEFD